MKYYEVAAKWWADKLRNNKDTNYSGDCDEKIEFFEQMLAQRIKEKVEKNGHMILDYNNEPDSLLVMLTKRAGININNIHEDVSMFIRPYNVTVYTGILGNYKAIYLENA